MTYYKTEKDSLSPKIWKKKYEKIYHIYNNEDDAFPAMQEIHNLTEIMIKEPNYLEIFPD